MERRIAAFFGFLFSVLFLCMLCVYSLSNGEVLAETAQRQSIYTLTVSQTRGKIYDCRLLPFTGETNRWVAAVAPGVQTAADLSRALGREEVSSLLSLLQAGKPFSLALPNNVSGSGILTFQVPDRYAGEQLAVHTIGYLDGSGHGASGLELAFDDFLSEQGGEISVTYQVDALNHVLAGESAEVSDTSSLGNGGLVLTLDKRIQRIAEEAASSTLESGAVVVAEIPSCKIRAMVSLPDFDRDSLSDSLDDPASPLLNRCLSAFSVGSVFKLVSAAAALESGISPEYAYTCSGSTVVTGRTFRCYASEAHGEENMQKAIANSCNTYFINLMQQVNPSQFLTMARRFGFGESITLAPGLETDSGVLPEESSLQIPQALANFSFGQGDLTATPLQITAMVNAIASGGEYTPPRLIEGTIDSSYEWTSRESGEEPVRILSPYTAALLQNFMLASIQEGTSEKYAPAYGGAGAKTATAQTGRFDENGQEEVHSWFAGFYPYDSPQYVIVVFSEEGTGGGPTCGPVFQTIANALWEEHLVTRSPENMGSTG